MATSAPENGEAHLVLAVPSASALTFEPASKRRDWSQRHHDLVDLVDLVARQVLAHIAAMLLRDFVFGVLIVTDHLGCVRLRTLPCAGLYRLPVMERLAFDRGVIEVDQFPIDGIEVLAQAQFFPSAADDSGADIAERPTSGQMHFGSIRSNSSNTASVSRPLFIAVTRSLVRSDIRTTSSSACPFQARGIRLRT